MKKESEKELNFEQVKEQVKLVDMHKPVKKRELILIDFDLSKKTITFEKENPFYSDANGHGIIIINKFALKFMERFQEQYRAMFKEIVETVLN